MTSPWIQTYTGVQFSLEECTPTDIRLEDIAHALSNLCRYSGHCRKFYSVAQHSVIVSRYLEEADMSTAIQIEGLLHDAQEAYLVDIPTPLKGLLPRYKELEERMACVVAQRFGMNSWASGYVKFADMKAFRTEYRDLMPHNNLPECGIENTHKTKIEPVSPGEAWKLFTERAEELGVV